jgi:RNA polymerase sigma-70 factor (ECF subfamily)
VADVSYDPTDDLAACARGERAALHRLYENEGPRLLGVVIRLVRERGLAEDILHDAFIRIWHGAGGFDARKGNARGWLYSIARHLALNALRNRKQDVSLDLNDEHVHPIFEDQTLWQGEAARLDRCLGTLEPERRACILHAYVDGYSQSQIAQRLNAPLGTVKAWITRSLKALRECMA